jgi:peptidoglycan hydrolase CwlO-like protein
MKRLSLILRGIAIITAILASVLFFAAQGKLEEKDTELKESLEAQNKLREDLARGGDEVLQLNASITDTRNALARSKSELDASRAELYSAKQEISRNQTQLKQAQNEINNLQIDLKNARGQLIEAERTLATGTDRQASTTGTAVRISP